MGQPQLHANLPGLIDALCDIEAMAVWELLRSARAGRSAEEVAGLASLSLTRTRLILEQLITLKLVESRPAGRGRRLTTYRVTAPALRIALDGMSREATQKMLARWNESRVEYFNRALKDGISPDGPATNGESDSGSVSLTSDQHSRLRSLMHQIGVLLRSAVRRDHAGGAEAGSVESGDLGPCAVLVRMQTLHTMPIPTPNVTFVSDLEGVTSNGKQRIDRGSLAPREREVAEALAGGMSRPEIAGRLGLSPHTVATLTKRVYKKLGIHNRAELVRVMMS